MLYASDYESDDDRSQYKPGKSVTSERQSFTVLSSVCWCWWKTLTGWPQSPTGQWVRHQLSKIIKRECTVQTETIWYKTSLISLVVLTQLTSVTDRRRNKGIAEQAVKWTQEFSESKA